MESAYAAVHSSASGCANQGLDIDADLSGSEHFAGRARLCTGDQQGQGQGNGNPCANDEYYLDRVNGSAFSWNDAFSWNTAFSWNDAFSWNTAFSWNDGFTGDPQISSSSVNQWVDQE